MKRMVALLMVMLLLLSSCGGEGGAGASSVGGESGGTTGTHKASHVDDPSAASTAHTGESTDAPSDDTTSHANTTTGSTSNGDKGSSTTTVRKDETSSKKTTTSRVTKGTSKKTTTSRTTATTDDSSDDMVLYSPIFLKLPSGRKPSAKNTVDIVYDPNGGKVCDDSESFTYTYATDFFTMGNTMPDNGLFVRKGYVLVGYSTQKTGGEIIGIGHKFKLPAGAKEVKLYCRWEKAADVSKFDYTFLSDSTVKITAYSGKEAAVYIPRVIDGCLVSTIGSGAFQSSSLTEVYIPSSVTKIESNAFRCPKLTKLTMFDSVTDVTDASFSGTKIKTLDLQMASFPRYADAYARKIERLVTSDKPCVIYAAGSSQHYGLDSVLAEKMLGGKYTVVNAGTNAQLNEVFYVEAITPLIGSDDIVVYTPEQYAINTYWAAGNPQMTEMTFRVFELNYECIRNVDLRNFTNVFGAFKRYTGIRSRQKEQYFEVVSAYVDKNGDCGGNNQTMNTPDFHNNQNGTFRFCGDFFDASFIPNMNRIIDALKAKGATVYFSHPSYNKNACEPSHLNAANYKAYRDYLSKVMHCPVIADVSDYIYEGQYFANTDYHLNQYGREIHTKQSVNDLLAAMKGA